MRECRLYKKLYRRIYSILLGSLTFRQTAERTETLQSKKTNLYVYEKEYETGTQMLFSIKDNFHAEVYRNGILHLMRAYNANPDEQLLELLKNIVYIPNQKQLKDRYIYNCEYLANTCEIDNFLSYEDLPVCGFPVNTTYFILLEKKKKKFLIQEAGWRDYEFYKALMRDDASVNISRMHGKYKQFIVATEGKQLFKDLCKKLEMQELDQLFLEELEIYKSYYSQNEYPELFLAQYYYASNKYILALKYAELAYEKRKVSVSVWETLGKIYEKIGQPEKALLYNLLSNEYYQKDLTEIIIDKDSSKQYEKICSLATTDIKSAPFLKKLRVNGENGVWEQKISMGEYLLNKGNAEYEWWGGVYNFQNLKNVRGVLADFLAAQSLPMANYCDMPFDLMKSKVSREIDVKKIAGECIVPIGATEANQEILFSREGFEGTAVLGKYEYSFFRLSETTKITSKELFAMGEPIQLGHSPKRKKLVMNILMDGMSWGQIRKDSFKSIPNIVDFFSQGVIFNNNYCVAEYTYPSMATIETGMHMHRSQIFHPEAYTVLGKRHKTISERMKDLGYYCVNIMGDGEGVYNGVVRGYDRCIANHYFEENSVGIERTIRHLEAFQECDNFLFLHVADVHPYNADMHEILKAQTQLPLGERLVDVKNNPSVFLTKTVFSEYSNQYAIATVDRQLKRLFDWIEAHYQEDEYIIQLYSDHGASVYADEQYLFTEEQSNAALMLRGAGVPVRGCVDELVSTLDIYSVMGKTVGFTVDVDDVDGNLPQVFNGTQREYVISNSIYPGQTYKLCIRTKQHEFRLETIGVTHKAGTVDLRGASYRIFTRDSLHREIFDDTLAEYFLEIAYQHTESFNTAGQNWAPVEEKQE